MTPAEELRLAADKLFKLPIQNTEAAHAEKDDVHRTMKRLAELWEIPLLEVPVAANDNVDMSAIAVGERSIDTRSGARTFQVESRIRRARAT